MRYFFVLAMPFLIFQSQILKLRRQYAAQLNCQLLIEAYRRPTSLLNLNIVVLATMSARSRPKKMACETQ